ncbi:hypothetical protein Ga0080574_TMP2024 [Salipiger abyssi]|uniref:Uncharacterized protein n=1 Tax=Salipiger abyssi TaxID=1250539 RepID=A0A1P8USP0_9RHOB|nr:hypothetical protein Ga0080574_TMP2024 [Salipiger abyssi]
MRCEQPGGTQPRDTAPYDRDVQSPGCHLCLALPLSRG